MGKTPSPQITIANEWFTVDKQGLGEQRENANPASILYEMFQNVADEDGATFAHLTLEKSSKPGLYDLTITDDVPGGFRNLKDAYRLFARSYKRDQAEKRGRFNVGEKLVLALAESAAVVSTTGAIYFNADGTRTEDPFQKTERGSRISAKIRLTKKGAEQAIAGFALVIPPKHLTVTLNGQAIGQAKDPDLTAEAKALTTVLQTPDGWRTTQRNTTLSFYGAERLDPSGQAWLYEMGIPVVEIDGRWSVSVGQKVPVTIDRDNVPPSYLRRIYVEVANATESLITAEDATETWAKEALEDERTSPEAVRAIITQRFGEKSVAYDPSDREGSVLAAQNGYEVIGGRALSTEAWSNVRAKTPDLLRPAGQVTPSNNSIELSGTGREPLDESKWTPSMIAVAKYAGAIAIVAGLPAPRVIMDSDPTGSGNGGAGWSAAYAPGSLRFNYGSLGKAWFANASETEVLSLLIHEYTHDPKISPNGWNNHQTEDYHRGLTNLGARLALIGSEKGLPSLADYRKAN